MTSESCSDPANALLPWYLNGTLEKEEEAAVARHVAACWVCAREIDELSPIAVAIDEAGSRRRLRGDEKGKPAHVGRVWAWAASVVLIVMAGAFWTLHGFRIGNAPPATPSAKHTPAANADTRGLRASLDLRSGTMRDGRGAPRLTLPRGAAWVDVQFFAPIVPQARLVVRLQGRDGHNLTEGLDLPPIDALGRCTYPIPAELVASPGDYAVVVTEEGSPARDYRYPFRVEAPSDP